MVENLRALVFTIAGSIITAIVAFFLTREPSADMEYSVREVSIPTIREVFGAEKIVLLKKELEEKFGKNDTNLIFRFLTASDARIFELTIKNLSVVRSKKIEVSFLYPIAVLEEKFAGNSVDTRFLNENEIKNLNIEFIDPQRSNKYIVFSSSNSRANNMFSIIQNNKRVSIIDHENDFYDFFGIMRVYSGDFYVFIVPILFLFGLAISLIIPIFVLINFLSKKDERYLSWIYNKSQLPELKRVVDFLERQPNKKKILPDTEGN